MYCVPLEEKEAFAAIEEPKAKWDENDELVQWPMARALGAEWLDHDFLDLLWLDDLEGSLSDHIVSTTKNEALVFDEKALSKASGLVVMMSRDPNDRDLSRAPDAPFQFLGVYEQPTFSYQVGTAASKASAPFRADPIDPASARRRKTVFAAVLIGVACVAMGVLQMIQ